jgi:hypothetical protein
LGRYGVDPCLQSAPDGIQIVEAHDPPLPIQPKMQRHPQ